MQNATDAASSKVARPADELEASAPLLALLFVESTVADPLLLVDALTVKPLLAGRSA